MSEGEGEKDRGEQKREWYRGGVGEIVNVTVRALAAAAHLADVQQVRRQRVEYGFVEPLCKTKQVASSSPTLSSSTHARPEDGSDRPNNVRSWVHYYRPLSWLVLVERDYSVVE